MHLEKRIRRLYRLAIVSFVLVFLVIIAGSVVRASGSGMGCPDWPLCFGRVIPPVSIDQLPPDYQSRYAVEGRDAIFNAFNTWTEYINRLVGVLAGLSLLVLTGYSAALLRKSRTFFFMALAALLLTGAEGFLGAQVVATYLKPYMVTFHMLLALFIAALLLRLVLKARATMEFVAVGATGGGSSEARHGTASSDRPATGGGHGRYGALALTFFGALFFISLVQIFFGTQVRESFDAAAWGHEQTAINRWIASIGGLFGLHEVSAFLVIAASVGFAIMVERGAVRASGRSGASGEPPTSAGRTERALAWVLVGVSLVQTGLGILMVYIGLPYWPQPIHLLLASSVLMIECGMFWRYIRPLRPAAV